MDNSTFVQVGPQPDLRPRGPVGIGDGHEKCHGDCHLLGQHKDKDQGYLDAAKKNLTDAGQAIKEKVQEGVNAITGN